MIGFWLGGRDSNPDSQIQSLESYHWTTSQQEGLNLRIGLRVVNLRFQERLDSKCSVENFRVPVRPLHQTLVFLLPQFRSNFSSYFTTGLACISTELVDK